MASADMSLLRGVEDGDFKAVAPVIVLPLRVICTWTEPYCVLIVAPLTVRVVDPPEVPDVALGAIGAVLVFPGAAAVVVREADAPAAGDALAEAEELVRGVGEAEGLAEPDVSAEEVAPASA